MSVDPQLETFLKSPWAQLPGVEHLTASMLRTMVKQNPLPVLAPPIHATQDLTLPGEQGPIRARLYRPSAARKLPLIVYFHGGGFVICDIDVYDDLCRQLANYSGCAVVSVNYRLAPEVPFPGPLEDCYGALKYLAQQGESLAIDPARLAVAGDSAGGNLATAAAQLARDRAGPALRYQALIYPALDPGCDSASMRALAEGFLLSREAMRWYWGCYLSAPTDAANPLAAPLRANVAGLPPATVITAEFDPLRDEGEAYVGQLRAAGVAVVGRRFLGMIHGFASLPHVTTVANHALADVAADLRAALTAGDRAN
jgi:acetyl esterase/lipase